LVVFLQIRAAARAAETAARRVARIRLHVIEGEFTLKPRRVNRHRECRGMAGAEMRWHCRQCQINVNSGTELV
jgi:hypothetical protein